MLKGFIFLFTKPTRRGLVWDYHVDLCNSRVLGMFSMFTQTYIFAKDIRVGEPKIVISS